MKSKIVLIDSIAFLAFLVSLMPDLTGLVVHEWLGLAIAGVVLVHFLQHWQWVISVSQNLFHSKPRIWVKYVVDAVLGISFIVIITSGLVISTLLMLPLTHYETWRIVHVISSYLTVVIIGFKLALHWISKAIDKWFSPRTVNDPVQAARRKFLRTCCITGLAALFAIGEFKEWETKTGTSLFSDDVSDDPLEGLSERNESVGITEVEPTVGSELQNTNEPAPEEFEALMGATQEIASTYPPDPTPIPTATLEPTEAGVETTGVVRCNRGCFYPGKCKRYQDTITQNNRCDLGEPIW